MACPTYQVPRLAVEDRLVSELLDGNEYPHSIADFLDTHLLQDFLITFDEVITIKVVRWSRSAFVARVV